MLELQGPELDSRPLLLDVVLPDEEHEAVGVDVDEVAFTLLIHLQERLHLQLESPLPVVALGGLDGGVLLKHVVLDTKITAPSCRPRPSSPPPRCSLRVAPPLRDPEQLPGGGGSSCLDVLQYDYCFRVKVHGRKDLLISSKLLYRLLGILLLLPELVESALRGISFF